MLGFSNNNSTEAMKGCTLIEPNNYKMLDARNQTRRTRRPTTRTRAPGCSPVNNNKTMGKGLTTLVGWIIVLNTRRLPYRLNIYKNKEIACLRTSG
jgi:hypothetical protein